MAEHELSLDEMEKIWKQVTLGQRPPAGESPAASRYRQQCQEDFRKALREGHMLEIPFDP